MYTWSGSAENKVSGQQSTASSTMDVLNMRASPTCVSEKGKRILGLANKFRFQLHRTDAIDFAIDIVIAVDQANVLDFGADLYDQR